MRRLVAILGVAGAVALLGGGDRAFAQRTCFALETQLMQLQARGVSRSQAARAEMLRERMAREGCGYGGQARRGAHLRAEPRPRGLFGVIAPRRDRGTVGHAAPRGHALRLPDRGPWSAPPPAVGTFRTICVRSCDGYYFPVSFSTTRDRFAEDAATCARMCPGREVALYYHPVEAGPEEMMSLAGAPYSALPTAFRYREWFDPDCSCGRPALDMATVAQQEPERAQSTVSAPLPRPRQSPAEDPETLANREGGFALDALKPGAFATAGGRSGRTVRQIGPRYGELTSELLIRPVSQ